MLFADSFSDLWRGNMEQSQKAINNSAEDIKSAIHACERDFEFLQSIKSSIYQSGGSEDDIIAYKDVMRKLKPKMRVLRDTIDDEFFEIGVLAYSNFRFSEIYKRIAWLIGNEEGLNGKIEELSGTGFGNRKLFGDLAITYQSYKPGIECLKQLYDCCFALEEVGGYNDTGNMKRNGEPIEYKPELQPELLNEIREISEKLMKMYDRTNHNEDNDIDLDARLEEFERNREDFVFDVD